MSAAVDFLEVLASDGSAMDKVLAFFRFQGRLTQIDTPRVASFGPRRVVYPQLASLRDEGAGFGSDPPLFVDRCLADDVVRFAEARALEVLVARGADA